MSRPTSGGCVYVNVADGKAYFRAQINFRGKRFAKNSKCRAEVEQWLYQKRRELGIGPALPKVAFKPENAPSQKAETPAPKTAIEDRIIVQTHLPGALRGWGAIMRW